MSSNLKKNTLPEKGFKSVNAQNVLIALLSLSLVIVLIARFHIPARANLNDIGLALSSLLAATGILLSTLNRTKISKSAILPASLLLIFISTYILIYLSSDQNIAGLKRTIQSIIIFIAFIFGSALQNTKISKKIATNILLLTSCLTLTTFFVLMLFIDSRIINPNSIGMLCFTLSALLIASKTDRQILSFSNFLILSFLIISIAVLARASFLALTMLLATYMAWHFITQNRLTYWTTFFLILTVISGSIFVLTNTSSSIFIFFDVISQSLLGRNLDTGRDAIWTNLIPLLVERPFFGWGPSVNIAEISNSSQSAHNLYIQIMLQVGLLGLVCLILILAGIWKGLYSRKHSHLARCTGSYLLGIMILQAFEVTLTQNLIAFGVPFWVLAGFALSEKSINLKPHACYR